MDTAEIIEKRKKLFHLPLKEDEIEYWGPVNNDFCNSFLAMGNAFFDRFLDKLDSKFSKTVFSAFVELTQNVSEYNEANFSDDLPQSYINLKVLSNSIFIKTANRILLEDVKPFENRMQKLESWNWEELRAEYKKALFEGDSLGLIMIKRMKDADLSWEIFNKEDKYWLSLELKIDYGKA